MRNFIAYGLLPMVVAVLTACAAPHPLATQPAHARVSGGGTTGPLALRRIELRFADDSVRATVARDSRLAAQAHIVFDGIGLFRAAWLVDGRVVENVVTHITFGDTLDLETAAYTVLPTFEPGPHQVTLRIEQPVTTLTIPTITYTVTADPASGARGAMP